MFLINGTLMSHHEEWQCGATLEGLCAPPGSPKSPVTRFVDVPRHMLVEKCVIVHMAPG